MAQTKSGVLINEYRPVKRGDYGVRVARNGFDATTAGDSNLLFNSGWYIIQIVRVISETEKQVYIDETNRIQSDWIETTFGDTQFGVGDWNISVDDQWLYLPPVVRDFWNPTAQKTEVIVKQYRIWHGLGYVPLFFKSSIVSNVPGKYLMTNVDIRKDADYPYTAKPSYYDGMSKNYGVKSKSYTRKKMPTAGETRGCGINTNIQSKLVMAVKTELTGTTYESGGQMVHLNASWGVPTDMNTDEIAGKITDYECFGFYCPPDESEQDPDVVYGRSFYVPGAFVEYPIGQIPVNDENGAYRLIDQWGAAIQEGSKASLVILRSPMVAPDIEEFTIS